MDQSPDLDINGTIHIKTPLVIAVERGHASFVRRLLEIGGVNIRDKRGRLLSIAARKGSTSIVRLLLDYKNFDIHESLSRIIESHCLCLLHMAANLSSRYESEENERRVKLMGILIDEGADINLRDTRGRTALSYSCRWMNKATVRLLLQKGADI